MSDEREAVIEALERMEARPLSEPFTTVGKPTDPPDALDLEAIKAQYAEACDGDTAALESLFEQIPALIAEVKRQTRRAKSEGKRAAILDRSLVDLCRLLCDEKDVAKARSTVHMLKEAKAERDRLREEVERLRDENRRNDGILGALTLDLAVDAYHPSIVEYIRGELNKAHADRDRLREAVDALLADVSPHAHTVDPAKVERLRRAREGLDGDGSGG